MEFSQVQQKELKGIPGNSMGLGGINRFRGDLDHPEIYRTYAGKP